MVASLPYHGTVLSMAILGPDTVRRLEPTFGYEGRAPLVYVRVAADPCGLASRFGHLWSVPLFFTLDGEPTLERPCGIPAGTDVP